MYKKESKKLTFAIAFDLIAPCVRLNRLKINYF